MEEVVRRIRIDATANTGNAESALSRLRDTVHSISGGQRSAASAAKSHSKALSSFGIAAKTAAKHSNFLADTLKRVVVYRALRAAIKEVVKMFQEGLTNAYWFSKGINGDLAQALDGLAVKAQTMKNQLGAAFGGLLQTIMPIIQQLISWITALASSITALFAMFGGRGTYLKAVDASAEFAKNTKSGAGSAKKMKDYLMGIDELNVIKQPNDGGGGGGSAIPDYASMFEVAELPEWMQGIQDLLNADMFISAGARLADYFNGLVANWDAEGWGNKLGEKIQNAIELAWGFLYGKTTTGQEGFDAKTLGGKIVEWIDGVLEKVDPTMLGNVLSGKLVLLFGMLRGMVEKYNSEETGRWLGDVFMGFVNKIPRDDIAGVVNNGIIKIVNTIAEFIARCDWEKVGHDVAEFIKSLDFGGIIDAVMHCIEVAAQGLGDFLVGLFGEAWEQVVRWWYDTAYEDGKFSIERFLQGIDDVMSNIDTWFHDHVGIPLANAVNSLFGIDKETSQSMREAGKLLPGDILLGINDFDFKRGIAEFRIAEKVSDAFSADAEGNKKSFWEVGGDIIDMIGTGSKNPLTNPFAGLGLILSGIAKTETSSKAATEELEKAGSGMVDAIGEGAKKKTGGGLWNWFKGLFKKDATGTTITDSAEENIIVIDIDRGAVEESASEAGKGAKEAFDNSFYSAEGGQGFFAPMATEFGNVKTQLETDIPEFAFNLEDSLVTAIDNIGTEYTEISGGIWEDLTFYFGDKLREGILQMAGLFKSQMMDCAGVARQEIGAIREELEKLDGYTVNVYIHVHTIGGGGLEADGFAAKGSSGGKKLGFTPKLAHGGIIKAANGLALPNRGQLFVAREAGAELVGDIGSGRTAVMNNNDIVSSVSDGVYSAMIDALSQTQTTDDRPIVVQVDGREIARAVRSGEKSNGYTLSSNPTFA